MRPARYAPENLEPSVKVGTVTSGFNEAGALCAGKCGMQCYGRDYRKASMRPARYAPENMDDDGIHDMPAPASMRPARYAPENFRSRINPRFVGPSFNEAGALCAGKSTCVGAVPAPVASLQ